jgi:hypothetical protein
VDPISNFLQVRSDGKLVPAGMKVEEMLARGWVPSRVIALKWTYQGRPVEFSAPDGVHGILVQGGNFVAAIVDDDDTGQNSHLLVLSASGSVHGRLTNEVSVAGQTVQGRFCWFEPPMAPGADTLGAIFQGGAERTYRCDVDARRIEITRVQEGR